jgi:hypothetical protein
MEMTKTVHRTPIGMSGKGDQEHDGSKDFIDVGRNVYERD